MIVFGPIPSRRLGQSIGVNNIPPKTCSYSCVYCQLGRTDKMQAVRREFYEPQEILREAEEKLSRLGRQNKSADYFSFVPDGEPTLDRNLGKEIDLLKPLGIRTAVITNASLLWMDEVKEDLAKADWVSVSIDAADEDTWRRIDRPCGTLDHEAILRGIVDFSKAYRGMLVTETMLVDGLNDAPENIDGIADLLADIRPDKAYLLVPTRPPAEDGVRRVPAERLRTAVRSIRGTVPADVECITGDEREEGFFFTDDIADDLLSITSVHPVREEVVDSLLRRRKAEKEVVDRLVRQGKLKRYRYEGKYFYRRTK